MLRIHFEADDLARVRVLDGPDPMWETLLSLHLLQDRVGQGTFDGWRSRVRPRLAPSAGLLATLAPPRGYSADFLTPGAVATDLDTAVDAVLRTPRATLREDLTQLAASRALPVWITSLAAGGVEVLGQLGVAIRQYFAVALRPWWPAVTSQVRTDRLLRGHAVLGGGVEGMLAGLHPTVRWRSPVLEMAYPVDQELHLGGRGLVLAPSFFCWQQPVTLLDPERAPVLVYPIERHPGWFAGLPDTGSAAALLGRTRAAVLEAICSRPHSTTTELASRLAISPAGASQHATVLRDSGLIATDRSGGAARHRPTSVGTAVLDAGTS